MKILNESPLDTELEETALISVQEHFDNDQGQFQWVFNKYW